MARKSFRDLTRAQQLARGPIDLPFLMLTLLLLAIGLPHEVAHGSVRLSLSDYNTEEDVDYILEKLPEIVSTLRSMSPLWEQIQKGQIHYDI